MNTTPPDSPPEPHHVPDKVKDILFFLHAKNAVRYWYVYLLILLLVASPFIYKAYHAHQAPRQVLAELESFLYDRQADSYELTNPPIPLQQGKSSLAYSDYVKALGDEADFQVVFVVGPAGAGKSVLRRQFLKELRSIDPHQNPVLIRLNKQGTITRKIDGYIGNDAKFYDLSQQDDSSIASIEAWLARAIAREMPARSMQEIEAALKTKSQSRLHIVIDDFDEVHRESRAKLINLIYTTLENQSLEKLRIIIMSRADALVRQQAARDLLELARESSGVVELKIMRIVPFSRHMAEPEYEEYLADALKWGTMNEGETDADHIRRQSDANNNFASIENIPRERLDEFLSWLDGANSFFRFCGSDEFQDDEIALIRFMQKDWYDRAQDSHAFPDFEEKSNFSSMSGPLLAKLNTNGVEYTDEFRPLLFTGLIELIPVRLQRGQFKIRPQFGSLAEWYATESRINEQADGGMID